MSTVERVHRAVLDEMLAGAHPPGSWLRQDEVAARLGVSKIPVREALQRLATARLVTFEAGRGVQVRPLTAADAEEVYALRLATEPRLLARAVPRLTAVDLAQAEVALDGGGTRGSGSPGPSATATANATGATAANWAFHRALYAAAGWGRALDVVESLHAAVAPYVRLYTDELGGAATSDEEHRAILDACRAEDPDTAVAVLRTHLGQAAVALTDRLAAGGG
jgi:DNA-binding GntR family transcriptional regulator